MWHRSGRIAAGLGATALILAGAHATRRVHAQRGAVIGSRVPALDAPVPGVWIFARADCGHCRVHLAFLGSAVNAYPDTLRPRLVRRIVVVGDVQPPCAGVRVLPDSLRRMLRIRRSPETWFVDAEGRVSGSWLGARGARAWQSALSEMAELP